ncbi:hypothetical protein CEXT_94581, partial [Caerostris extrusa]
MAEEPEEDTSNQDDAVIPEKNKEEEGSSDTFEDSSPSEAEKSEAKMDERLLRHIFVRPRYAEPRHPILSSPYARHISLEAFGPKSQNGSMFQQQR